MARRQDFSRGVWASASQWQGPPRWTSEQGKPQPLTETGGTGEAHCGPGDGAIPTPRPFDSRAGISIALSANVLAYTGRTLPDKRRSADHRSAAALLGSANGTLPAFASHLHPQLA